MPRTAVRTPFGKELAKIRIDRELDLIDMAADLGISGVTLRSYETGTRPAPLSLFQKVKQAYGADLLRFYAPADAKRPTINLNTLSRPEADYIRAIIEGLIAVPADFDLVALRHSQGAPIH